MSEAHRAALFGALKYTLPIFTGFLFLGTAYGIMMTGLGFAPWMPILMASTIVAGSMEFVTVSLLLASFNPIGAVLITFMVNGRHLFYGLSLLEPYKKAGLKSVYMIFALVDETYSLLVAMPPPAKADQSWYMFYVSLFIHSYWVIGTVVGALAGAFIGFNTTGIEFVMTALFVVLFTGQWRESKGLSRGHKAGLIGLGGPFLARLVFGPERFMIPAMVILLVALIVLRPWLEDGRGGVTHES